MDTRSKLGCEYSDTPDKEHECNTQLYWHEHVLFRSLRRCWSYRLWGLFAIHIDHGYRKTLKPEHVLRLAVGSSFQSSLSRTCL